MQEIDEEVKVWVYQLRDIRFADEQGMVASTKKALQTVADRLTEAAKTYDMKIKMYIRQRR